jgi:hypothetical protein
MENEKYFNLIEDEENKTTLNNYFDETKFHDIYQQNELKKYTFKPCNNINSYESISDCAIYETSVENKFSNIEKNEFEKTDILSNKLENKSTEPNVIHILINFVYVFFIVLLIVFCVINRKVNYLIISLILTLCYIFYKIYIEKYF